MPNILIQRYEDIVNDSYTAIREISDHLGYSVNDTEITEITEKFSIESNRKRSDLLKEELIKQNIALDRPENTLVYDKYTLLHWNHVRNGSKKDWRNVFTPQELIRLEPVVGRWLIETGYEQDDYWAFRSLKPSSNYARQSHYRESNTEMESNSSTTLDPTQNQWLNPVQIGTSTLMNIGSQISTIGKVIDILRKISPDEYIEFMINYYQKGLERFGEHWKYVDQLTILYASSEVLNPQKYLEIGVFRGRSMSVVASVAPDCDMYGFDLWVENYSGLQNTGSSFVQSQLNRVEHRGNVTWTPGNSNETIPLFFHENPDLFFDLITVDGDHSEEGARIDLENVLPRVKVGGVLVFDDIRHPKHPWLERVWDEVVGANPNFLAAKYTEVGHGVAFAIRRDTNLKLDALRGTTEMRIRQLSSRFEEAQAEISELQEQLALAEADRATRQNNVQTLERLLSDSESDRAARLRAIEQQGQQLTAIAAERDELHARMTDLQQRLNTQAAVMAERQQQLDDLHAERNTLHAEAQQLHAEVAQLHSRWATLQPALLSLRASRVYRLARKLGWGSWFDQALRLALPPAQTAKSRVHSRQPVATTQAKRELRRIAVDLTPVLPGGENGGAKLMTIELVNHLSKIAPECELILLTAERSHAELATLDAPNVRRICMHRDGPADVGAENHKARLRRSLRNTLATVLPARLFTRLKTVYRHTIRPTQTSSPLKQLDVDLVFCPFTAPLFFEPTIPTVAVVYDLQHFYYPQFFTAEQRNDRTRHFTELSRLSSRLICISEYVRGTILEHADIDPARVKSIHIQLPHRFIQPSDQRITAVFSQLGLANDQFLLYPANFWPHKNHRMLLTAFGMYRARHPESQLKLVCTGNPDANLDDLQQVARRMLLGDQILFPGYLADDDLAVLLKFCYAIIYPSLYEGFGMPLIEAMAFGKPVLAGNVASLPEIAGDAALFFDPRKPEAIVDAIERIMHEPDLAAQLVLKGYQRLDVFDKPAEMARQYLQVFREAVSDAAHFADGVHGVYSDGWVSENVMVTFGASSQDRQLEITLTAPDWIPHQRLSTRIAQNGNGGAKAQMIEKGKTVTIVHALPQRSGYIELLIDPVFQPKALGLNDDERGLACVCQACRIVSASEIVNLLDRRN